MGLILVSKRDTVKIYIEMSATTKYKDRNERR